MIIYKAIIIKVNIVNKVNKVKIISKVNKAKNN